MPPTLRLNPDLDPADFAEAYARDGFVQIPDILPADVGEHLFDALTRRTQWRLVYSTGADVPVILSQAQLTAMSMPESQALFGDIYAKARDNIGFLYSVWPMIQAYLEKWDLDNPLHRVHEFLQTEEVRAVRPEGHPRGRAERGRDPQRARRQPRGERPVVGA